MRSSKADEGSSEVGTPRFKRSSHEGVNSAREDSATNLAEVSPVLLSGEQIAVSFLGNKMRK